MVDLLEKIRADLKGQSFTGHCPACGLSWENAAFMLSLIDELRLLMSDEYCGEHAHSCGGECLFSKAVAMAQHQHKERMS